jgi:carboxyl-terminal processing protease
MALRAFCEGIQFMPRRHPFGSLRRRVFLVSGLLLIVGACGFLGVFLQQAVADPVGPQPVDRQITLAVAALLKREHLSRHPLDDEMSARWVKMYLKTLDPMKVYFTQADVDSFMRRKDELDDMARRGDVSFGYTVFRAFLDRIDERVKLVDELLKVPHDFTIDEEMITDPEASSYAKSEAEVRDIWRKRIKFDLLVLKADKGEKAEAALKSENDGKPRVDKKDSAKKADNTPPEEKLSKRYHSFAKRMHQTNSDELLEMYLTSLTTSYDPHSTYMSQSSLDNFDIQMKLKLEGIGAALMFTDGYTVVSKIIPAGAADKEGHLKPEDKIIGVGQGDGGEIEDVMDMTLNDVVKRIRGTRGTVVRLKVIPVGQIEPKIYSITRAEIALTDSEARSDIQEVGKKPDGAPLRVGIIDLPSFYMDMSGAREGVEDFKSTTRDVAKLLKQFNEQRVDAVVIDLRKNGGGSLTEAINLTGLFIDTGPVVQVKDADGRVQHYDDMEKGMGWTGPLVVMTSKFSASASEIFAGAIQDYRRGLIVGDTSTHGKGTVQSLLDLGRQLFRIPNAPQLGALKITMQQFYRPNGDSTQNRGVLADVDLPSLTSQLDVGESSLDYALKFDRVAAVPYRTNDLVNGPLLDQLRSMSEDRRKGSKDWNKVLQNITRYNAQKKRKRVPLNEQKFMAERAELNSDKEEEKELDELNNPSGPVFKFKRDYYNDEVLNVTVDYVQMLKMPPAAAVGRR